MTPYIARLEQAGFLRTRESLDAARGARNRRYEIADPFLEFWLRFVLPYRSELELGRAQEIWEERVRPKLTDHVASIFPRLCREALERSGRALLGARARESGAIWSTDESVRIDVAGILEGGAVCYGTAHWTDAETGLDRLEELDLAIRRTSYGVGKMQRVRILFSRAPFSAALRARAAAEELLFLVPAAQIAQRVSLEH